MKAKNVIIVLGLLFAMPFFSSCEKDNEMLEATKTSKKVANRMLLQARGPITIGNESNLNFNNIELESWGAPSNIVDPAHKLSGMVRIDSGETAVFDNYKDVSDLLYFISQWEYRWGNLPLSYLTASNAKSNYAEFYDAGNPTLGKFTHWTAVKGIAEVTLVDPSLVSRYITFDFKLVLPEAEGTTFTSYSKTVDITALSGYTNNGGDNYYLHYEMSAELIDQGNGVVGTLVIITYDIDTNP